MKEWTDPDDRLLASSLFGTDHVREVEDLILTWTAQHGFDHCRVDTIEISIGAAVTISSPNRQKIVVKVWPGTADVPALAAQTKVQNEMATPRCVIRRRKLFGPEVFLSGVDCAFSSLYIIGMSKFANNWRVDRLVHTNTRSCECFTNRFGISTSAFYAKCSLFLKVYIQLRGAAFVYRLRNYFCLGPFVNFVLDENTV
jgi:hypothetical protein